ncbi:Lrp/AsnC family transcriptional regulator, partial [Candidatus Woesearchaeota archaeon]|nr:Lrp/AsnC family transcriptional regulator [Candidatus Woesearchaeota archaeon]
DLDLKDRKILYELDCNSRQPNSDIAKKVGLSKQVVGFRIHRLLKDGILSSFYSIIDISKLGFTIHKNFLRLQNLDRGKERELIDFLVHHPHVVWVASCDGRFDLAFGTWARDMAFLDATITELNKKFGMYIAERQIATIIRGEYFTRDYLIGQAPSKKEQEGYSKKQRTKESSFGSVPSPIKMGKVDWAILHILAKNARTTAVDIAKKTSISADAVAERIKRLETSGVLRRYNLFPNELNYPYLHYKVLIGLRNSTEHREKLFLEYCKIHSNIVYLVKSLGPWEFEIDIEVDSADHFRKIMMDIKAQFSDILKDYSSLHLYQVHKYNFCPSIPLPPITRTLS